MVAKVSRRQLLNAKEADFVREFIATGGNAAEAYRRAYQYKGRHADMLAVRVTKRAKVREAIEEMGREARESMHLDMKARRGLLARIARHEEGWNEAPSYTERVAAIREDAHLAGERRNDGTQINIGGDVNLTTVLAAVRGDEGLSRGAVDVEAEPVGDEGLSADLDSVPVEHGFEQALLEMRHVSAAKRSKLVSGLSSSLRAILAQNPSPERLATIESELSNLRESVPATGKAVAGMLRSVRDYQSGNAPRGLPEAAGGSVAVPGASPRATRQSVNSLRGTIEPGALVGPLGPVPVRGAPAGKPAPVTFECDE